MFCFLLALTNSLTALINQEEYTGDSLDAIISSSILTDDAIAFIEIKEGTIPADSITWTKYVNLESLTIPETSFSGTIADKGFMGMQLLKMQKIFDNFTS